MFGQELIPKFAFCKAVDNPAPTPDRLPGDVCSSSAECLGEGTCDKGICEVNEKKVGSSCTVQANCTLGQYCDGTKCELTKKEGSRCSSNIECEWTSGCYQKVGEKEARCTMHLSLDDGKQVNGYQDAEYCSSEYVYQNDNKKYYCMPGDESITSPDVARDLSKGDMCFFKRWTDPDNLHKHETMSDEPRCGFNINTNAYCNVRKGDKVFKNYLKTLKETYKAGVKCHTVDYNDRATTTKCAQFIKKNGANFMQVHNQVYTLVSDGGNAKIRNN